MRFSSIYTSFFCLTLSACSGSGYLIHADQISANTTDSGRSPASKISAQAAVAPTVGNPCSGMRFLKSGSTNAQIYRCNVVLDPQVNSEAKLQLKEADLCVSFYTVPDDRNNPVPAYQLNGILLSLEEIATKNMMKNLVVRSTRTAGEPMEKSNHLDYFTKNNVIEISDLIPLSGGTQKATFDAERKTFTYETFEAQGLDFMPIVKTRSYGISAKFQCTDDIVYYDPSQSAQQ